MKCLEETPLIFSLRIRKQSKTLTNHSCNPGHCLIGVPFPLPKSPSIQVIFGAICIKSTNYSFTDPFICQLLIVEYSSQYQKHWRFRDEKDKVPVLEQLIVENWI